MSLKTDQLRYFVTVAEEGQITRAAKKLYIAQPALSQAIAQLESELGLQLLERHAKGVRLTAAGEAFLEKARAVVETEREVSLTAESLARAARGVLEVGFIGPPPPLVAHELFTAFADAHPDCEVSFRELPFPRGDTRALARDRRRRAVPAARARTTGIGAFPVRVEPRALMVSAEHPLCARAQEVARRAGARGDLHQLPARRAAGVGGLPQPRRPPRRPAGALTTADHVAHLAGNARPPRHHRPTRSRRCR